MNRLREHVPDNPKAKVGICLNPNVDRAVRSIVEDHWYFRGLSHFYEFAAARLVEAVDRGDRIFKPQGKEFAYHNCHLDRGKEGTRRE